MKPLSENRRARFDYEILETIEAGLVLKGFEVKAAKIGRMQITGSHVIIQKGAPVLIGSQISPYQAKNTPEDYDPQRIRKLLLNKREIARLVGLSRERGLTIVPLRVYTSSRGILKLECGISRGKKEHDKREKIKERETQREIERALKRG